MYRIYPIGFKWCIWVTNSVFRRGIITCYFVKARQFLWANTIQQSKPYVAQNLVLVIIRSNHVTFWFLLNTWYLWLSEANCVYIPNVTVLISHGHCSCMFITSRLSLRRSWFLWALGTGKLCEPVIGKDNTIWTYPILHPSASVRLLGNKSLLYWKTSVHLQRIQNFTLYNTTHSMWS